ncbi:DUF488 domain-containing protein [Aromatoleum petrolei]|uniref:DUF488 family protein n=1 Tax=Aromatoleum petrolei TaxID=76116 RepID=A0ABX1MSW3_9RHOO|nr:DUF488 family protein [Aromatoleum petrolei]NMF89189.1 DUF488 family protein [Aromatoleum petrolei]QTQ36493.1 putative protein DUF488 [Aromatoleum petrolei]
MVLRIVRLGTPRAADEGLRIGTVRRPPRGVPKAEFATRDWYDVWYPNLAPSVETMKLAQQAQQSQDPAEWQAFVKRYRAEMSTHDNSHSLDLLAALSQRTNFSVGCYCADESHCHRSVLRTLLQEHGAEIEPVQART